MTHRDLTDEQWARLQPLLPPQKPETGKPSIDHRRVINGILWILRTGADLAAFRATDDSPVAGITVDVLRRCRATIAHLRPATRARQQAALAGCLGWAERQDLIAADPMAKVERVRADPPEPRGLKREQIDAILAVIPRSQVRDR